MSGTGRNAGPGLCFESNDRKLLCEKEYLIFYNPSPFWQFPTSNISGFEIRHAAILGESQKQYPETKELTDDLLPRSHSSPQLHASVVL